MVMSFGRNERVRCSTQYGLHLGRMTYMTKDAHLQAAVTCTGYCQVLQPCLPQKHASCMHGLPQHMQRAERKVCVQGL